MKKVSRDLQERRICVLGNKTIQFNTRGNKSEPGLRKQLNIDVKSTTKFYFFFKYMSIFIYFTNIRRFRFNILYFKYLQTLILCVSLSETWEDSVTTLPLWPHDFLSVSS